MPKPPIKRIREFELRQMFNQGRYWERVQSGQLKSKIMTDKHPSSNRAKEPICTRSQYIIYVNSQGQKVAGVHQYLRPDGKLGASGRPDPKELFQEGVLYILDTTNTKPRSS